MAALWIKARDRGGEAEDVRGIRACCGGAPVVRVAQDLVVRLALGHGGRVKGRGGDQEGDEQETPQVGPDWHHGRTIGP